MCFFIEYKDHGQKPRPGQVRYLRVRIVEDDGYRGPWGTVQRVDPPEDPFVWMVPVIVGLAVTGVALTIAFVAWELRVPEPLLPMRLFRNPVYSNTNAVSFLFGFAFFGAIIYLPVYLQVVRGYGTPGASVYGGFSMQW